MASVNTVFITYILLLASKLYNGPYIMVHVCCKIMISSRGVKFDQKALSVGLLSFSKERGLGISKICNNPSVVRDSGLSRDQLCIVELCKLKYCK